MKNYTVLSYEEVVSRIENERRFGNLTGVDITKVMLEHLGHPESGMKFIHVAGTNGKGSVSAFLCSILQEAGFKVGTFVSPHLVDFCERICMNKTWISREDVARIGTRLLEEEFEVYPTMFDYCLSMAMIYFKEQQCDVAIIETGLGGRLDSTNALGVPEVTVLTKIGYDHMAILGNTLTEIALEKAGILKTGTKLVIESQEKEVEQLFIEEAEKQGISNYTLIQTDDIKQEGMRDFLQYFSYRQYEHLCMKMLGVHQYENAVAAILAAEKFTGVSEEAIRRGIEKTFWEGRMEVVSKSPFFIIDGAHNSNGVDALKNSLMSLFPGEKFHFIMGVMADKDYEEMVDMLLPIANDFKTVTVESNRALQAEKLAECIAKRGVTAVSYQCMDEVLKDVLSGDDTENVSNGKTVALGSLYFIGDIKAWIAKNRN